MHIITKIFVSALCSSCLIFALLSINNSRRLKDVLKWAIVASYFIGVLIFGTQLLSDEVFGIFGILKAMALVMSYILFYVIINPPMRNDRENLL